MATTITYHSIKIGSGNRFKEKNFEADIEHYLLNEGGYVKGDQSTYDKKQAKNTDAAMFATAIFPKAFQEIAQKCYIEQMDAFAKLFEDPQFYERVMKEMAEAMYLRFRNGK